MPLRLITGPANAGKTGIVLKKALAAAAVGASPVIAVPSLADVRRLESELSGKASLGIRVVTLPQLTIDLWSLYGDGRRVIDEVAREALLGRVLENSSMSELDRAAGTPGFRRLISRVVAQSPVAAVGAPFSEAGQRVGELVERYRRELARIGLVEPGWLGDLLAGAPPRLDGPVGVARFDSLAAGELRLLCGLAQPNDVDIAITWEHMFPPTRANDAAVEHLSAVAVDHLRLGEPPPPDEIQLLARKLYSGPAAISSQGSVVTGLASGAEAEAALIARFVAEEIAAGIPAERIAVAFGRAAQRADGLERALRARGVCADFDVSTALLTTQFGRAWHGLLSLAAGRGGRVEALTYIASPYSGGTPASAHELDRRWRRNRVTDPRALLASMGEGNSAWGEAAALARSASREPLTSGSVARWQKLADNMIASARALSSGRGVSRAASQDAAAHQAIGVLLGQMSRHPGEPVDMQAVLAASTGIRVRGRAEESAGRVQVCDFRRVGSRRFDVVVLAGLTEDEVSLAPREGPEEELRSEESRQLEGEPADRLRLQFYSLVSRARTRLYLVRQEADSEGRERRASALLEDALDAYRRIGASADGCPDQGPPVVRVARADIEELAPALTFGRREARKSAEGLRLDLPDRGAVSSERGLSALANASGFSATEIETYLACPYRWFYERIVRPEEIDRTLDARELGTLAHGLLAAFYRRLAAEPGHTRVCADWLPEALDLFEEVVASERAGLGFGGGLSEELDAARAVAWARNVVGQDAMLLPEFVPELVEFSFGDAPAFSFAGHSFRGRIDRIDTSPKSVFVTDYKSSRDVPGIAKFEAQAKVQAVIYAIAAETILGRPTSGSVYRAIRSGRLRGFWRSDLLGGLPEGMCEDDAIDAAGFAALVEATEQRVDEAIGGMRAGRIPRVAAIKGACTFCSLSSTCEGAQA
jgi:ATP-dependent helicase/nuclease subunit B